jgi:hypothetical protein
VPLKDVPHLGAIFVCRDDHARLIRPFLTRKQCLEESALLFFSLNPVAAETYTAKLIDCVRRLLSIPENAGYVSVHALTSRKWVAFATGLPSRGETELAWAGEVT